MLRRMSVASSTERGREGEGRGRDQEGRGQERSLVLHFAEADKAHSRGVHYMYKQVHISELRP